MQSNWEYLSAKIGILGGFFRTMLMQTANNKMSSFLRSAFRTEKLKIWIRLSSVSVVGILISISEVNFPFLFLENVGLIYFNP